MLYVPVTQPVCVLLMVNETPNGESMCYRITIEQLLDVQGWFVPIEVFLSSSHLIVNRHLVLPIENHLERSAIAQCEAVFVRLPSVTKLFEHVRIRGWSCLAGASELLDAYARNIPLFCALSKVLSNRGEATI